MNIATNIIAVLLVYLLPFLTGRVILRFFKRDLGVFTAVAAFAVGGLTQYAITLSVYTLGLPERETLWIYAVVITLLNLFFTPQVNRATLRRSITTLTLVILVSVIAFAIWKFDSPYPYTLNWDIFEHQTLVNEMRAGTFSVIPSQVSDTFRFDGYTTLFHALIGVPQILLQPDRLGFWWMVEFVHLMTTVMASYVLGYSVTRKPVVAMLSAILGASIFESYVAYASLFLVPQTLSAMLSVFALSYVFNQMSKQERMDKVVMAVWLATILAFHLIVGAAVLLLIVVMLVGQKMRIGEKAHTFVPVWIILTALTYVILAYGITRLPLSSINYGEAASYIHPLTAKIEYLRVFYGWLLFAVLPFSTLLILLKGNRQERMTLLLLSLILAVVASPLPYVFKFYVVARYLVQVVMAVAIGWVMVKVTAPLLRIVLSTVLLATLSITLVLNARYWKDFVRYGNQATLVSSYEIEAAKFIEKTYTGSHTMLVSDPTTVYVLEAVSGVNGPGGAYMNQANRENVNALFGAQSQDEFKSALLRINDSVQTEAPETYLVVVSGRSDQWYKSEDAQKYSLSFNVFSPKVLSLNAYQFGETITGYGAKSVFANREVMLFEVGSPSLKAMADRRSKI